MRMKMVRKKYKPVREFWKAASGNYKMASVNTSRFIKKKRIIKRIMWVENLEIPFKIQLSLFYVKV